MLAACTEAASAGAEQLLAWRNRFKTREKAPADLVTDADLAAQEAISDLLARRFPDHAILGEEGAPSEETIRRQLANPYCWVVDPLDGTTNYVHGFPCFAVSIAVAQRGELIAGVVYDPIAQELFAASRGEGATLNGQAIYVSRAVAPPDALVAVSFPPRVTPDAPDMRAFMQTAPVCQAIRRTGSAALNLAYVACGRLDAHWAYRIRPWDAAAGVLLVREAGGVATAGEGGAFDLARGSYFVAATPRLHAELQALIGIETA